MIALSPKHRFQAKDQASKSHKDLVVSPSFQDALASSLAQMQYDEGTPALPELAAASWHRLAGARAFVHVLLNLCEPPPEPLQVPKGNLNHTA
jgi:hypothetical protein